ncbi:hypothetical protein ABGB07_39890 [Micromonosporaceae bacterium B7E4]
MDHFIGRASVSSTPTLELPRVAAAADWLSGAVLDPEIEPTWIEDSAETVSNFLRSLVPVDVAPPVDEVEHYLVAGSGGVAGECSVECACGVTFAGFDTHAEARELLNRHIADATARPARGAVRMPDGYRVDLAETMTLPVIDPPTMKQEKQDDRRGGLRLVKGKKATRPSDELPYPSTSPAAELGRRAFDLIATNDREHRSSTTFTIAATLGVTEDALQAGMRAFILDTTGFDLDEPARLEHEVRGDVACPGWWCTNDHTDEVTERDGFHYGSVHERIMLESTALDPSTIDDPATVRVYVDSTTEAGRVSSPMRLVVAIAEGPDGAYPGDERAKGWSGTPEQARALIAALRDGLALVEADAVLRAER